MGLGSFKRFLKGEFFLRGFQAFLGFLEFFEVF